MITYNKINIFIGEYILLVLHALIPQSKAIIKENSSC